MLLEALLAVIFALPAPWSPPRVPSETPEDYRSRMATIARAIELESGPGSLKGRSQEDIAAFVAVTWYHESGFALDVHEGRRRGPGGHAACLGQIHDRSMVSRDRWIRLTGSDLESTRRCARATVTLFLHHVDRCVRRDGALTRGEAARVFEAYGSGSRCSPGRRAHARSRMWFRVRNKLSLRPREM